LAMNFIVATRKESLFVGFGMSQVPKLLLWKKNTSIGQTISTV